MTDEYIDEAIASGGEDARLNADNAELENDTAEQEQQDEINEEDQQDDADSEDDDDDVSKKVKNAMSRKDRKIGKLHAKLRQTEKELQQLQQLQQQVQQKAPAAPIEDDFDNWGDFQDARVKFLFEQNEQQKMQQQMQQHQQQVQQQQQELQQQWADERASEIDAVAAEISKTAPELNQLFEQNATLIQSLPPHVHQMFAQADSEDACHAFYALAKEGKLQQLSEMSPYMVAATIGRAADRGVAMLKKQTISKAPQPMSPNKGTSAGGKDPRNMSTEEYVAFRNRSLNKRK